MTQSVEFSSVMTRIALSGVLLFSGIAVAQRPQLERAVVAPAPADAKQLNTEGFRLYNEKKYAEAIEKFRAATQADPKLALGWYNLAATLSLMRKENRTCEFDAYRHTVTDALKKAVELDRGRKKRMQKDSDLDAVRDTIAYQQLLGTTGATKEGLSKLLQNVSWWGPATGAFGSPYGAKFLPQNVLNWWELEMNAEGEPNRKPYTARWSVGAGGTVTLELPARGDKKAEVLRGKFDGKQLVFEGADGIRLLDYPSECEA